jgi:hypothetical protein
LCHSSNGQRRRKRRRKRRRRGGEGKGYVKKHTDPVNSLNQFMG